MIRQARKLSFLTALIAAVFFVSSAHAATPDPNTYTFTPSISDLAGLDHAYVYQWVITDSTLVGRSISNASITFKDIYNYNKDTNTLYVHLLNDQINGGGWNTLNGKSDIFYKSDSGRGDFFSGKGYLAGTWSDKDGPETTNTLNFTIPETYFPYLTDGKFVIAIDPDCHFYNRGIQVDVATVATPEPASFLFLLAGCCSLIGVKRFKIPRT